MISIIVPVYNTAAQLPRCLDSILAQSYYDLELIAVNDGSTDSSGTVLDSYGARDPRIRIIHQENAGATQARLTGVAAARGEWIGFVDGDDAIEPDMYQRLVQNAVQYDADISHCGYRMVFPGGRVNWFYNTGRLVQQDTLTGLSDLLEGDLVEPGLWNKLFRRDLFSGLALEADIQINEDLLMNYLLFSRAKSSVFEDFCPYHYIIRPDSASRTALNHRRIWDPIRVRQRICDLQIAGMADASLGALLGTCIHVYNSLMLERGTGFRCEEPKVRSLLLENRKSLHLLRKKQQLLAHMILFAPQAYRYVYRIYAKFFLVDRYS